MLDLTRCQPEVCCMRQPAVIAATTAATAWLCRMYQQRHFTAAMTTAQPAQQRFQQDSSHGRSCTGLTACKLSSAATVAVTMCWCTKLRTPAAYSATSQTCLVLQFLRKMAPPTDPYLHNDLHLREAPADWPGGWEAW